MIELIRETKQDIANIYNSYMVGIVKGYDGDTVSKNLKVYIPKIMYSIADTATTDTFTTATNYIIAYPEDARSRTPKEGSQVLIHFLDGNPKFPIWRPLDNDLSYHEIIDSELFPELFKLNENTVREGNNITLTGINGIKHNMIQTEDGWSVDLSLDILHDSVPEKMFRGQIIHDQGNISMFDGETLIPITDFISKGSEPLLIKTYTDVAGRVLPLGMNILKYQTTVTVYKNGILANENKDYYVDYNNNRLLFDHNPDGDSSVHIIDPLLTTDVVDVFFLNIKHTRIQHESVEITLEQDLSIVDISEYDLDGSSEALIFVDGILLDPSQYNIVGETLTNTSGSWTTGQIISLRLLTHDVIGYTVHRFNHTNDSGGVETNISIPDGNLLGTELEVFVNGIKYNDFSIVDNETISVVDALQIGDNLDIVSYKKYTVDTFIEIIQQLEVVIQEAGSADSAPDGITFGVDTGITIDFEDDDATAEAAMSMDGTAGGILEIRSDDDDTRAITRSGGFLSNNPDGGFKHGKMRLVYNPDTDSANIKFEE